MTRKNKPKAVVVFLMFACSLLLAGCQQQPNDGEFQILVFSTITEETLADMKADIELKLEGANIILYPSVAERLILEIVRHSGDIIIMDRELLATAYDSKELYPLDEFRDDNNTVALTDFELVALQAAGEEVKQGQIYPNAIRVAYMDKYDMSSDSLELVAIIPKYAKNKEMAFSILERLVQ